MITLKLDRCEILSNAAPDFTSFRINQEGVAGFLTLGYREATSGITTSCFTHETLVSATEDEAEGWLVKQAAPVLEAIAAFVKEAAKTVSPHSEGQLPAAPPAPDAPSSAAAPIEPREYVTGKCAGPYGGEMNPAGNGGCDRTDELRKCTSHCEAVLCPDHHPYVKHACGIPF